jgi:hypothetical protein
MSITRGSVLAVLGLSLVLVGTIEAQAQGNRGNTTGTTSLELDGGGLSALRTFVMTLVAQVEESKQKIARLEAALAAEVRARQAADVVLQNNINAISGGGVTQAYVDAAIAQEAGERSTADTALEGQIANEAAARAAADLTFAPLSSVTALSALVPLAAHVTVAAGDINGLAGPHVIFSGANVHVRSGHASGDSLVQNGLGNLILGYNESGGYVPEERGGSHNVVAGPYHRYNFGVGLVVGYASRLGNDGASVSGGFMNQAAGEFSSVSGGSNNSANGMFAAVSGGDTNTAGGDAAAVSAGQMNQASGTLSSVSGGFNNQATATASTVGGGAGNINPDANTFVP